MMSYSPRSAKIPESFWSIKITENVLEQGPATRRKREEMVGERYQEFWSSEQLTARPADALAPLGANQTTVHRGRRVSRTSFTYFALPHRPRDAHPSPRLTALTPQHNMASGQLYQQGPTGTMSDNACKPDLQSATDEHS